MNKQAASYFLSGLIDYINKTPPIGWEAIRPAPKIETFEDEPREHAIALWKQADDARVERELPECAHEKERIYAKRPA